MLDSRPKGRGFEPHRRHCVVSLSKNINPSLVLVKHRKTRPYITERFSMGRKESNQTSKFSYRELVTVVYPFKWNTVLGNTIQSKMKILNLTRKIYFNQKPLTKNIFLKFVYVFINGAIGWNFNILYVLCQITFPS